MNSEHTQTPTSIVISNEITPELVREWLLQGPVGLDQHQPERCRFETFLIHTLAAVLTDPEIFRGVRQRMLLMKAEQAQLLVNILAAPQPAFVQPPRAFQCGVAECPAFNGEASRA